MDKQFDQLRHTWDYLGERDPLWAILSDPRKRGNRWQLESFFATGRHEVDTVLQAVANRFPEVPHCCALDFGCGVGRLTRALAAYFDRVIGIDVAASMIRQALQLNADIQGCEFVLNERADLSLVPSGSVDFIYSNIVLQHIERPYSDRYLQEFVRVLSPRGLAVFQIPYQDRGRTGLLFRLIPSPLLGLYRRVRYGRWRYKMHAIAIEQVHAIVCEAGGRVVQYEESGAAGDRWKSKLYFVCRSEVAEQRTGADAL
jgi:SAM-dependent methyltransferase